MRRLRDDAVRAVLASHAFRRRILRWLAWPMVVLLLGVLGLVTAVVASGEMATSEYLVVSGFLAPLFLASCGFTWWTYRRGEAPLVEALSHQPPRVRGASVRHVQGAPDQLLLEVRTLDGRLWFVPMPAPLVDEVAAWLQRAASNAAEGQNQYRQSGVALRPVGHLAWSSLRTMPPICAGCAATTEKHTVVAITQADGGRRQLSVPMCSRCRRRRGSRVVVPAAMVVASVVVGVLLASSVYPPGAMRGVIVVPALVIGLLGSWSFRRLVPMPPVVAECEGGTAGEPFYVRFANSDFHDAVAAANAPRRTTDAFP